MLDLPALDRVRMRDLSSRWTRNVSIVLAVIVILAVIGKKLESDQSTLRAESALEPNRFDLILEHGTIVDGSGGRRYVGDIGIIGDHIAKIGDLSAATANRTLDVSGKIVAPGFIDLHAHVADGPYGEYGLLSDDPRRRAAQNYVAQGVTTALGNPDGRQSVSLKEQRDRLRSLGIGINIALTNGHNSLRAIVMGDDQERPASAEEIRQMQEILQHDLAEEGSFGLSLGSEYFSGRYSTTDEQIALARVLPTYNGIFIPHLRSQGIAPMWYVPSIHEDIDPPTLTDAIDEVLSVATKTGVTVVFTHMKAWGPGYRGRAADLVARFQAARDAGANVYLDVYPYTSSGSDGQFVGIPEWAFGEMLPTDVEENIVDYRESLVRFLDRASSEELAELRRDIRHVVDLKGGIENIFVLDYPNEDYIGRRLSELIEERGLDDVGMILALQKEGYPHERGGAKLRAFSMADDDIKTFYRQPWTATSSDGWIVLPETLDDENKYRNTHRRLFGSFPRRIAHYSQKEHVDTLEEAVRSMTGLPAGILNISDRGLLAVETKADIVVFDLDELEDTTTYLEPSSYPKGIDYVLVNGQFVVNNGERTLSLPGRVLDPAGR